MIIHVPLFKSFKLLFFASSSLSFFFTFFLLLGSVLQLGVIQLMLLWLIPWMMTGSILFILISPKNRNKLVDTSFYKFNSISFSFPLSFFYRLPPSSLSPSSSLSPPLSPPSLSYRILLINLSQRFFLKKGLMLLILLPMKLFYLL